MRNDLAGLTDFDCSYQGSECFVTVKLTRWNESTLLAIENVPSPNVALDATGTEIAGDIGRLMVTQGAAYPLWVQYSYAAGQLYPQAAFANAANGAMRVGYHFYAAFLGTEDNHEGGTDPATEAITFRCIRTYAPSTGAFTLYDRDMSSIAGAIPN